MSIIRISYRVEKPVSPQVAGPGGIEPPTPGLKALNKAVSWNELRNGFLLWARARFNPVYVRDFVYALEMIIEQGYTFENFQKTCDNVLHVIINFTLAYGYPEKILKVYETLEKELVHDISRMREQVKRYIELRGGSADSALMKLIDKLEKEKSNAQQSST